MRLRTSTLPHRIPPRPVRRPLTLASGLPSCRPMALVATRAVSGSGVALAASAVCAAGGGQHRTGGDDGDRPSHRRSPLRGAVTALRWKVVRAARRRCGPCRSGSGFWCRRYWPSLQAAHEVLAGEVRRERDHCLPICCVKSILSDIEARGHSEARSSIFRRAQAGPEPRAQQTTKTKESLFIATACRGGRTRRRKRPRHGSMDPERSDRAERSCRTTEDEAVHQSVELPRPIRRTPGLAIEIHRPSVPGQGLCR